MLNIKIKTAFNYHRHFEKCHSFIPEMALVFECALYLIFRAYNSILALCVSQTLRLFSSSNFSAIRARRLNMLQRKNVPCY